MGETGIVISGSGLFKTLAVTGVVCRFLRASQELATAAVHGRLDHALDVDKPLSNERLLLTARVTTTGDAISLILRRCTRN